MKYELPQLSYSYTALEPQIDAQTMEIHHTKHHQAYITNLNAALEKHPELQEKALGELLSDIEALPQDIQTTVRNNGGGHHNHLLFWENLTPGGSDIPESLKAKIVETFESVETFKEQFEKAAMTRFGSGWAWLVKNSEGSLEITSTPNQDSPLMNGQVPLLGLDVWEHAYYLKYQNRRAEYVSNWWQIVNWEIVANRL